MIDFKIDEDKRYAIVDKYREEKSSQKFEYVPSDYEGYPVRQIGPKAFQGCNLSVLVLPMSIQLISESAFEDCTQLQAIGLGEPSIEKGFPTHSVFPPNLEYLGKRAFKNCSSLTDVTFTGDVTIDEQCFADTENLKGVVFHESNGMLSQQTFMNSGIEYFIMSGGNGKFLPKECFYNCKRLYSVSFKRLDTIADYCFCNCANLSQFSIEDNLPIHVQYGAFEGCRRFRTGSLFRTLFDLMVAMGKDLPIEVSHKLSQKYTVFNSLDEIIVKHKLEVLMGNLCSTPEFYDSVLISYTGTEFLDASEWYFYDRFALFSLQEIRSHFEPIKEWSNVSVCKLSDLSPLDTIRLSLFKLQPSPVTWDWAQITCILRSPISGAPFEKWPREIIAELLARYFQYQAGKLPVDSESHVHSSYDAKIFPKKTELGIDEEKVQWLKFDYLSNNVSLYDEINKFYRKLFAS